MNIGDRSIAGLGEGSDGAGPYVIAEIGVNHDGSLSRALKLIDLAADAGAHAVKFQYFRADALLSDRAKLAAYQSASGESDPLAMLRRLELSLDELDTCCERAHVMGVDPIVTVFTPEHSAEIRDMGWAAFKTASPDVVNTPLLEAVAADPRPLIVSTGAATIDEVRAAASLLSRRLGTTAFLQCVSSYPVPDGFDALDGIHAVAHAVPDAGAVGYSDHTPHVGTGAMAVRRGAAILEKHFTDDTTRKGPDHAASLGPRAFASYVEAACSTPIGDPRGLRGSKSVLDCETDVRTLSRQSLAPARDLPAGRVLAREDLTTRRPGTGIPASMIGAVVGRRLVRPVRAGMLLEPEDVSGVAGADAA